MLRRAAQFNDPHTRREGGVYLSGPLTLSSGDTFQVARGATLLGTADHDAYRDADGKMVVPLISAHSAHDIALTGEGTIDGQGASWWKAFRAAQAAGSTDLPQRPKMIVLTDVTNLRVVHKTGFIKRRSFEMSLDKVESVDVNQSILGRILNYGDVTILGVGEGKETISTIASPLEFRNYITAR